MKVSAHFARLSDAPASLNANAACHISASLTR